MKEKERRSMKYHLLDMTWSLHTWVYSSCGYLHWIQPIKIPVWLGEGLLRPQPWSRKHWQVMVAKGGSHCRLGTCLLVGCLHLHGWPHTYAYGVNTKWTQKRLIIIIILIIARTWNQEGHMLVGFKYNWSQIVEMDKIKIYYIHVWNFQRMNGKYYI